MNYKYVWKMLALLLVLNAISASSFAEDYICPPNPGATTIDGNVLVAGDCVLTDTVVIGNVFVYAGGSLVTQNARIDGNIQAEDAGDIRVESSYVGGSIQLDRLVGDVASVVDSQIIGSVQLNNNRATLTVDNTIVGADIQAFANTGGVSIVGNTIDGNLQCKDNTPAPTGSNNTVGGNAEDQCETFATTSGSGSSGNSGGGVSDQCDGSIGAITVDGDLIIASACELNGTTIDGNIVLYAGGSLAASNIRVIGNIQADNAFEIDVVDSIIGGNIQFDSLVGDASVSNSEVDGSVQLNDNRFALSVSNNRVQSDVQAFANIGGVDISQNTVDGNLQCKDNTPAPTGGGNTVAGNKEDQCSSLQPAENTSSDTGSAGSASNGIAGSSPVAEATQAGESGGGSLSVWMLLLFTSIAAARRLRKQTVAFE